MKEISNTTLALLVVVAISVSVFGTLVSLNKINQLGGIAGLTGMASTNATGIGRANLSIPSTAYINVTDDFINLGSIDLGLHNSSDTKNDWWIVKNDGSVNISLRLSSHAADNQAGAGSAAAGRGPFRSTDTGNTLSCLNSSTTLGQCFRVKCYNSSYTAATCNTTYDALPVFAAQATSRMLIVDLANTPDTNDTAWFGVNVTVPLGEPSGALTQTVEFYAESS